MYKPFVALIMVIAGCGATVQPEPPAGLPPVSDLARMASETGGAGSGKLASSSQGYDVVTIPEQGFFNELSSSPDFRFVWLVLAVDPFDDEGFAGKLVSRISPVQQMPADRQGAIFMGVADFAAGTWRFQDCTTGDLGIDIDPAWDITNEEGDAMVVFTLYDPNGYCLIDPAFKYDYEAVE